MSGLYGYDAGDVWVWVVVHECEIFELKVEEVFDLRIDEHLWQRTRLACELQLHLFDMVAIYMCVTEGVYEVSSFKSCYLRHHHEQKSVGCDIEWHA